MNSLKFVRRVCWQMTVQDFAAHRRRLAGPQGDDGLHPAAVFVPHGEAEQQVLDGVQAGLLEVRGLARTDALQELQGGLQASDDME